MKRKKISFKLNTETKLPKKIIEDSPSQGRFDDYCKHLREVLDVNVSLNDSIKFLRSYGTWDDEELQNLDSNIDRILWLACLDCKEQKTQYFYMGE